MLNHITLMGRLVRDPDKRTTQSGVTVTNFTIAVDRDYKNGDEKVADFVDIVAWRGTGDFVANFMTKGRMVVVDGSLQSRKWEDKEGNKRTAWEVQAKSVYFADSKKSDAQPSGDFSGASAFSEEVEAGDGDLPF